MARSNLTDEEREDRFIGAMVVMTKQVEAIPRGSSNYEETGREWFEYRSVERDPNGSKYLGVPMLAPPSLTAYEIWEMLRVIYPNVRSEYYDEYKQDPAMRGGPQIIFDNYQFLTPRDGSMVAQGLFTTLSFHNKLIGLFRKPGTRMRSSDVHG